MPTLKNRLPRMRKHGNRAIVSLSGQQIYLGKWGSSTARAEYERQIAEWLTRGRTPSSQQRVYTIDMLMVAFLTYAQSYYVKNGEVTNEFTCIKNACKVLRNLYGHTPAEEFGPVALEATRNRMIEKGWSRKQINKQIGRLVRMFKWGASKELVSAEVTAALKTLEGLKKGRSEARETLPVNPVSDEAIEATLPFLPSIVADMVRLQRVLGCRPGEICQIRPIDIDRSGDVWVYQPQAHKTEHLGREKSIFVGPRGQEILRPYLERPEDSYCFSPAEAENIRREEAHKRRTTPASCGNRRGINRKSNPKRRPKDHYTKDSYGKAIRRGCEKAWPPKGELAKKCGETKKRWERRLQDTGLWAALLDWNKRHSWSPNQLRHTRASEVRRQSGLEAAQVTLGHASADVTQIYAERDQTLAIQTAKQSG